MTNNKNIFDYFFSKIHLTRKLFPCIITILVGLTLSPGLLAKKDIIDKQDQLWIKTTSSTLTVDWSSFSARTEPSANIKISDVSGKTILWEGTVDGEKTGKVIRFSVNDLKSDQWTPATPSLYYLDITLNDNKQKIITTRYRIGFRNFETKDGKLFLNGHPIFLRGIAINPPGRGIPKEVETSRKFAEEYVSFMKGMNVNIIRIPDDQTWYDVCDELGIMVFGGNYGGSVNNEDPPADYDSGVEWYKKNKFYPIMHHPSLMIYALTNEVPFKGKEAQKWETFLDYAFIKLKEWDPTRLYIGNAGYGYGKGGDINDLHRYWGWYYSSSYTYLHIRDYDSITLPKKVQPLTFTECVGNYTGPDGRYNLTPNHKNPVSQQNWTGHAADVEQAGLADQHQSFTFKTVTELIRRLRRINPESSGVFPFTIMFRNWHTITGFMDMAPKPVTAQARLSYQPVLISWESWQNQVYAGSTLKPTAHIINDADDFSDLKNCRLVVRLVDKAYTVRYSSTIKLPDIPYYAIHSQKLTLDLPKELFTGDFTLEGIVYSEDREVSRNISPLFIAQHGFAGIMPENEIMLYDPSGITAKAFDKNGIPTTPVSNFKKLKRSGTLVIGENSADNLVGQSASDINGFVNKGGRLIILKQEVASQPFAKKIIPAEVGFPVMDIDNPSYPPPSRPSRNSFNINPERPGHPVFTGITRDLLRIWSDYNGWDETMKGYPAFYPVTDGFILKNKSDIATTAVLANYSVGLEGIALAEFFSGNGSILLSGFDISRRAGIDPVADRLLSNMIKYMSQVKIHENHILVDAPLIWGRYETEKGILTGIYSGFMLNSKPALTGSYEGLPLILFKDGHMFGEKGGGWNNAPGKQYVPYGRRLFGPYVHRDFGGVPTPVNNVNPVGTGEFWCRLPPGTGSMFTTVWNPSEENLKISVFINDRQASEAEIAPGKYLLVPAEINKMITDIKVTLKGDRRLVVLETRFE